MEKTHQPVCCCGNACRVRQFAKIQRPPQRRTGKDFTTADKRFRTTVINYQVIPDPNYYFNTGFMTENELFDPFTYGDDEIPVGDFMGETITDFCKTDFYLTNNVVTSWQWRGNACDAL